MGIWKYCRAQPKFNQFEPAHIESLDASLHPVFDNGEEAVVPKTSLWRQLRVTTFASDYTNLSSQELSCHKSRITRRLKALVSYLLLGDLVLSTSAGVDDFAAEILVVGIAATQDNGFSTKLLRATNSRLGRPVDSRLLKGGSVRPPTSDWIALNFTENSLGHALRMSAICGLGEIFREDT